MSEFEKPVFLNGAKVILLRAQANTFRRLAEDCPNGLVLIPRTNTNSATAKIDGFDCYRYTPPGQAAEEEE